MGSKIINVECSGDNTAVIIEKPLRQRRKQKESTKVAEVSEVSEASSVQLPVEESSSPSVQGESESDQQLLSNPLEPHDLPIPSETVQESVEVPSQDVQPPHDQQK